MNANVITVAGPFRLEEDERRAPVWLKVRAELEQELKDLREKLEHDHDAERTANLRGQIAQVKKTLAFDSED